MAFRLSQKGLANMLTAQGRSLSTSTASRTVLSRARTAVTTSAWRASSLRCFSSSRMSLNEEGQRQRPEQTEQPAQQERRRRDPENLPPARTVFIGSLPFFTTQEDLAPLLEEFGPVENIKWGNIDGKSVPFCHVTYKNLDDAVALVESHKQEPFHLAGRDLNVNFAKGRTITPTNRVFFKDFNGDLVALRNFLGSHAVDVDHAFFAREGRDGPAKNSGLIRFRTVEQAAAVIQALNGAPGPDGKSVFIRYAIDNQRDGRKPRSGDRRPNREENNEQS